MSKLAVQALVDEILAPGSKATTNERDAAQMVQPTGLIPTAAVVELKKYYERVHLGQMGSNLRVRVA